MILFNKKGTDKIYHLHDCRYAAQISAENRGYLNGHKDALEKGYRCCICCDSIARHVRQEREQIEEFCREYEISCLQEPGALVVNAHKSQWRIVPRDAYLQIALYHRNWLPGKKTQSDLKGYHPQKIKAKTIMEYLVYIVNHDAFKQEQRETRKMREQAKQKKNQALQRDTKYFSKVRKGKRKESFCAGRLYSVLKG